MKRWMDRYVPYSLLAVFLLSSCDHPPAKMETNSAGGQWNPVEPPAGAPAGTTCWIWSYGIGSSAYGGPECFAPTTPTATPTSP